MHGLSGLLKAEVKSLRTLIPEQELSNTVLFDRTAHTQRSVPLRSLQLGKQRGKVSCPHLASAPPREDYDGPSREARVVSQAHSWLRDSARQRRSFTGAGFEF